ncbi:MAG: hypothetical protein WCR54_05230 [Clostridia bacterium]
MIGVIDIGSNSVRLLYNKKKYIQVTQLSEGLLLTNNLQELPMERTINATFELYKYGFELGATTVLTFATEAVRSAKNSIIFVNKLKNLGINIDIIDSKMEAQIGFLGAYTTGKVGILDIGGASSELIVGDKNNIFYDYSLNYGCVRLKDFSLEKNKSELFEFIHKKVQNYGAVPPFEKLIGIGGTATSLAAIILELDPYDPEIVHNSIITYSQIEKVVIKMYNMTPENRMTIRGIHPKRALVLPYGGFLLLSIMSYLKVDKLTISENDNLEGYLKLKGNS